VSIAPGFVDELVDLSDLAIADELVRRRAEIDRL